jgi:tetratricopeptide (TPR) repeat protein
MGRNRQILALLVLSALAAPAGAGEAGRNATEKQARNAYEKGLAKYDTGDYEQAVAYFKQAYDLKRAPLLLFNIAQAYRLQKDYVHAAQTYRTYLRVLPNAPNRDDVESLIVEVSAHLDENNRTRPEPAVEEPSSRGVKPLRREPAVLAPSAEPAGSPLTASPPRARDDVRKQRARDEIIAGTTLAAVGVAGIGVGAYFVVRRNDDMNQIQALRRSDSEWTQRAQAIYDDGRTSATAANALFAVGGVLAVGGGVLAIIGATEHARARPQRHANIIPVRGGATAVWGCEF